MWSCTQDRKHGDLRLCGGETQAAVARRPVAIFHVLAITVCPCAADLDFDPPLPVDASSSRPPRPPEPCRPVSPRHYLDLVFAYTVSALPSSATRALGPASLYVARCSLG